MSVSRVDQLDSECLDQELESIFSQQMQDAFKFFLRNPWDAVGPELSASIKIVLWSASIWSRGSSIGQQLLSLKFYDPSKKQLIVLGILNVLRGYLNARQSTITKLFPSYEEKLEKILKYYNIIIQCLEIVNFLVFLQRGVFPLLTHRILGLKLRSEVNESRNQQFTYMSRELLWHSLSEIIIFTLPLLKSSRLSAFFRSKNVDPNLCGICGGVPVLRVTSPCDHVFCYYCAHAQTMPRCSVCGYVLDAHSSLKMPAIKSL